MTPADAARMLVLLWSSVPVWATAYAVLSMARGLLAPLNAWLLAQIIDGVVARDEHVFGTAIALSATAMAGALLTPLSRFVEADLGRRMAIRAKSTLMRSVNASPGLAQLESPAFLDRLRLAEQAGTSAPQTLVQAVFGAAQATVTAVGLGFMLQSISWWLVPLAAAGCVPAAVAAVSESRNRARMVWQMSSGMRREMFYAGLITDARAAQEIRVFGLGGFLHARMVDDLRRIARAQRDVDRRATLVQAGLAMAAAILAAGALLWGIGQAADRQITVGQLSILITGLTGLQTATATLARAFGDGHHSVLVFGHYRDVVSSGRAPSTARAVPGTEEPAATAPEVRERGDGVRFVDVSFGYGAGAPSVLSGVSFTIPHGAMVALVGANGAGKSTVVKLLCRLYEPSAGAIFWDGTDIRDLDPSVLRQRVGVLFQDFMRYDLTAAENIGLGQVERIDDRRAIHRAAGQAGVDGRITALRDGYDTMLSRAFGGAGDADGVQLSGGQWQRLALARTLMRTSAELMILDEPSSGLDADAEASLYRYLRSRPGRRSCLLVSHRFSAVRDADLIVVLSAGQVAEQGTHQQLMDAEGEYARLFRLQADGYGRRRLDPRSESVGERSHVAS